MRGKINLGVIYLFSFMMGMHFMSAVLYPFYTDWGELPQETAITTVTALQLWFMACVTFFETPTGFVADKFGRKWSLAAGGLVASAGWLIYTAVPQVWCFALGEMILALAVALISGADTALLFETCHQYNLNKQKAYSWKGVIAMTGLLIGAPVGSLIAVNLGVRYPFLLESIPTGLAGLVIILAKEPARQKPKENYVATVKKGIKLIRERKKIFLLALNMTLVANLGLLGIWLYQPLLTNLGVNLAHFGTIHAVMVAVEMVIMLFWQPRAGQGEEFGKLVYIGLSAAVPSLAFVIMAKVGMPYPAAVASIALVGFGMSRRPFFEREINEQIGHGEEADKIRATTMSLLGMMRSLSQVGINVLAIVFAAHYLNELLFWAGAGLGVFAILWHLTYKVVNGKR